MRMLVLAPYQVLVQEGKKKSEEAETDLHSAGMSDTMSGRLKLPLRKTKGKEKVISLPLMGGKGLHLKTWRWKHPREGRYPYHMVRVPKPMSSQGTSLGTSPLPNRK